MGLDIMICANNDEEPEELDLDEMFENGLSRTFCNLMFRKGVIETEPEFDQVARIAQVDISPIYAMEDYIDEEAIEYMIEYEDADPEEIMREAEISREKLENNIGKVISTIDTLTDKLKGIDNLPKLLAPTDFDTLGNQFYFSDFNKEAGNYVDNNFGQDLRNFRQHLMFLQSHGATMVWFNYA